MKEQKIIFVVLIVFTSLIFSGCFEEDQSNQKKETIPLKDLGLKVEDLPVGYIHYYTGTQYLSEFSNQSVESIQSWFTNGSISNLTDSGLISCELNKFNETKNAIQCFEETINILISIGNFSIINESINIFGDESKSLEKKGFTDLLVFRIKNIIVVLSAPEYSLTLDLAKIVEQRIKNSNY
jgi:hypothetical protein